MKGRTGRLSSVRGGALALLLLLRREQVCEAEDGDGLPGAAEGAYGDDVEDRRHLDVGGVGPLHPARPRPRTAGEAPRTARAPLQAVEYNLARRAHARAVHRHTSRRLRCRIGGPLAGAQPHPR